MKRLLVFCIFLGMVLNAFPQESFIPINYKALEKKLEKSNAEIQHPKKGLTPQAWIKRGDVMVDIYKVDIEQIYEGMDPMSLKLFYKEPKSVETIGEGEEKMEVYKYERVDFNIVNNRLVSWNKTETLYDDPLHEANRSYQKALELDEKGKFTDKIKDKLISLKGYFKQEGLNAYYSNEKTLAIDYFSMVNKVNELEMFKGEIDTVMVQYTGIIAREINDFKTSARQYEELIRLNFGGPNTFIVLKEDYLMLKDTLNAISAIEKGFDNYPDSATIVANLIDLYLKVDMAEKGLEKIEKSINQNPQKAEYYYWKGRLLLNTDEESRVEDALEAYKKAIEVNPTLYYVYYDVGLIYFLHGQELFNSAAAEKDIKFRDVLTKAAIEKYESSYPMLEKSNSFNESNPSVLRESLDTLKRIYYRLQMMDKYAEVDKKLRENNLN